MAAEIKELRTSEKFNLAKKALFEKKLNQAKIYFQECFQEDVSYIDKTFKLLYAALDSHNGYKMEFILEILKLIPNKDYQVDYNLAAYLLRFTDYLSLKGRCLSKNIHYEDVKLLESDTRYLDIPRQNKIREIIYKQDFIRALHILNKQSDESLTLFEVFVKNCLKEIKRSMEMREIKLFQYIYSKNYKECEKYLIYLYRNGIALYYYSYLLKLTRKIIEIEKTGVIPEKKDEVYQTVYAAINNEDYEKAIEMYEQIKPNEEQKCNRLIKMLLLDINELIQNISLSDNYSKDNNKECSEESRKEAVLSRKIVG